MSVNRYLRLIAGFFVLMSLALGYWPARTGSCSRGSWA